MWSHHGSKAEHVLCRSRYFVVVCPLLGNLGKSCSNVQEGYWGEAITHGEAITSVMHVFSITTGVDISPAFGSLSGGTVLALSGSAVDGVDALDKLSVAVDIAGIPCDIDTYTCTWLGCSPNYLLPFPSPAVPYTWSVPYFLLILQAACC